MTKEDFIKKRPYLYHLTEKSNVDRIMKSRILFSAQCLISSSDLSKEDQVKLCSERRPEGRVIKNNREDIHIRDQQPLFKKSLEKSLTGGMKIGEYIELLNSKVFFWPTVDRLKKHYQRYEGTDIVILRVSTQELLAINEGVEFSSINSGATRPVPFYRGAHPRGKDTFLLLADYPFTTGKVAEVVFSNQCILPENVEVSNTPIGEWEQIN